MLCVWVCALFFLRCCAVCDSHIVCYFSSESERCEHCEHKHSAHTHTHTWHDHKQHNSNTCAVCRRFCTHNKHSLAAVKGKQIDISLVIVLYTRLYLYTIVSRVVRRRHALTWYVMHVYNVYNVMLMCVVLCSLCAAILSLCARSCARKRRLRA